MNVNEPKEPAPTQTSDCVFMKLPKCKLQDVSRRLDMSICLACISGRTERHLFDIKEILATQQRQPRG
jgi:hypothetical protein